MDKIDIGQIIKTTYKISDWVIILLMDRLQQKQLQKLRQQKQEKVKQQQLAIKTMMEDDSVRSIFDYCKRILAEPLSQTLSDYSPSHLSKFVFDQQLQKAKIIFDSLPNQQCTIQHFLLLMISIMKFPFQKWPYYLVGLKDMFNQIVSQKCDTITYQSFFKYVIGQVLDFKEEQQNTQFQVRFQELKKQDYLLHDNGVKKFYYSTDTKLFMTLDESSPVIKLYNKQMRLAHRFTPNKQKHNKKYPNILHFDYSEMTSKLGIVLSDSTLSIINLDSFLNRSKFQFDSSASNEVVISFEDKMLQVYYIQMLNKWVLVSDINKLYTFDLEKHKQNDPNFLVQIKIDNDDLKITNVLQLVNLSMICVVAGNQVYFFNQNFTEKKHAKYAHGTNIKIFRYSEELGCFYISGDQKFITIVTLVRNTNGFQIKTFDTQSKYGVCTFDVFPAVGTMVVVDNNKQVRLFDLNEGTCYQMTSYAHIVKNEKNQIKMFKISKSQFALYQTYTLVFNQEKIAIEKDTEFNFLSRTYYDTAKEEFYVSVNNQIISFSVFQGEIRKSFNMQTANIPKHDAFVIGKQTNLFVLDSQKNVYEAYLKQKLPDGQNKSYKKKIGVSTVVDMFYDQETSHAFIIGPNSIHTIRNDKMNNFTVTSFLNIEGFPLITAARYNSHEKYILALTNNQQWMVFDAQSYRLKQYYSFIFPIDPNDHEDILVEHFSQDEIYNIDILLTNRNQITLISREDRNNRICLKLQNYLPFKQKSLQFTNMKYCKLGKNNNTYILLSDKTGYILELNITKVISKNFKPTQLPFAQFKYPAKDLHTLEFDNQKPNQIYLSKMKTILLEKSDYILFKGHDREVKILAKIEIEGIRLLTISTDGHIKLWEGQQMLFHLRLPDLKKMSWNMAQIQKIKNQRSVQLLVSILNKISGLRTQKASPQLLLKKNHKMKANQDGKEVKKFNIDEPIQLQIQNKDLEQIIHKTHNINWYTYKAEPKKRQLDLSFGPRTNPHPWRTKNQFRRIMQKASPENKYQKKMPLDLINLRNSLDMRQRSPRKNVDIQKQLKILPELNGYVPEKKISEFKPVGQNEQQQNEEAFQSCLYVKKKLNKRKLNQFDEIDNQFQKKWLALTARKFIPKSEGKRKNETDKKNSLGKIKIKNEKPFYYAPVNLVKYDPIKQVKSIFQNHNREISVSKKGRLIRIPEIKLRRQDLFSTD